MQQTYELSSLPSAVTQPEVRAAVLLAPLHSKQFAKFEKIALTAEEEPLQKALEASYATVNKGLICWSLALEAASIHGGILQYLAEGLRDDKEVVISCLTQSRLNAGFAWEHTGPNARANICSLQGDKSDVVNWTKLQHYFRALCADGRQA